MDHSEHKSGPLLEWEPLGQVDDRIVFDDLSAAKHIAAAAGCGYVPSQDRCIARIRDGRILGGVVYQNYTRASIEMHVAGLAPSWLSRSLLFVAFGYPFLQLGCLKVIGRVAAHNKRALEFDLKLGFNEEARIRDVYPEGDLLILTMRRDECRWLNLTLKNFEVSNGEE